MEESWLKSSVLVATGLLAFVLLPILTLWPALSGSFMLDDYPNLDALHVLEGEPTASSMKAYLAEKSAGPTGRPLSMLSFVINDAYWPSEPGTFKYTNLMIHVLNGVLLFWLVLAVVRQWSKDESLQSYIALSFLVAAFWLLNPYQLSSVMYVVQRMAQLSTLCVLVGLLLYLSGRRCLDARGRLKGYSLIWLGYLVGAGIGVLFKENAALFVLLVPLFDWLLFPGKNSKSDRPLLLKFTLGVPAVVMLAILASYFFSTHTYEWYRDFSLYERLLSQGRAVGYYLWRYLIPGVGYVGVYADGFEKSVGLLQPLSTLVWILIHAMIVGLALVFARRSPLFSLGVLFFYVAHSLESSAVALELFFEHRNYLPSMLLLLALFHLPWRKAVIFGMALVVLACAALQYLQATFWGDEKNLGAIMMVENPSSERGVRAYASYIERHGDVEGGLAVMRGYAERQPYGMDVALNIVKTACFLGVDSEDDAELLLASTGKYRGKAEPMVRQVRDLARLVNKGFCKSISFDHLEGFLDSYMAAYPRDGEATQAQLVARSYLAFYRGNYAEFSEQMNNALEAHPNLSLAYSACAQFTVIGGVNQGCDCFRKYEYLQSDSNLKVRTLTQMILDTKNHIALEYRREFDAVCSSAHVSNNAQS